MHDPRLRNPHHPRCLARQAGAGDDASVCAAPIGPPPHARVPMGHPARPREPGRSGRPMRGALGQGAVMLYVIVASYAPGDSVPSTARR